MKLHRIRIAGWRLAVLSAILFALGIVTFVIWLNKPYPSVYSSPDWTRVSVDGPQRAGDIVAWTKPKVCVPAGVTKSEIFATTEFAGFGTFSTVIQARKFDLIEGYCGEPNYTAFVIPATLPNGTYTVTVTACTENPTPSDRCIATSGPPFTVVDQPLSSRKTPLIGAAPTKEK